MTKRYLTEEEIQNLLDRIDRSNTLRPEINTYILEKARSQLRVKLSTITIYPQMYQKLSDSIVKEYYRSTIQPGDCVGVLTAQSIGENQTQSTLNSFHHSGITSETVVTGVPRFAELLNATKRPKSLQTFVYFSDGKQNIQECRSTIGHSMVELNMRRLIDKTHVHLNPKKRKPWYDAFEMLYGTKYSTDACVTFYLNVQKLFKYQLSLSHIADIIEDTYSDLQCIYSPDAIGQLDVFVDTSEIDMTETNQFHWLKEKNKISVYINEVVIPNIQLTHICGVAGIDKVFYRQINQEWMIEAMGSNLSEILKLDYVDTQRTYSNNMWDIFEIFGIEAVREFLIEEFKSILSSETYINVRHIYLLIDIMLFTGTISSISRYGVHRNQSGPMSRSSFEESLDNFLKAGLYGEVESTNGVSAAIICGKPSNIGTGLCDLVYNPNVSALL
jgi:DNA-directed RNA polymerase beta' subunit